MPAVRTTKAGSDAKVTKIPSVAAKLRLIVTSRLELGWKRVLVEENAMLSQKPASFIHWRWKAS